MELPEDVCHLIHNFARPLTRGDWHKGSYLARNYLTRDCSTYKDKIIELIDDFVLDVPMDYTNYLTSNMGIMILNYNPSFEEVKEECDLPHYKVVNFGYELHKNTCIIRSDYIEYENI
jgi:hypothetical protein